MGVLPSDRRRWSPWRAPWRRWDAEDRRYLGLLHLTASAVCFAAGWALSQPEPLPPVIVAVPDRLVEVIVSPPRPPPERLAPRHAPATTGAGRPGPNPQLLLPIDHPAWGPSHMRVHAALYDVDPDAEAALLEAWAEVQAPDAADLAHINEDLALLQRMGAVGQGPLEDRGVGPLETLGGGEVAVTAVRSSTSRERLAAIGVAAAPALEPRPPQLDAAVVRGVLRTWRVDFDRCLGVARRADPGLEGRLDIRWTAEGGRVRSITVGGDREGARALESCLRTMSRRWVLPADAAGEAATPLVLGG